MFVAEQNPAAAATVAKYAKNFLPRLFNLIAPADKEGTDACRLAALETLKCYLKICDQQVKEYKLLYNSFTCILRVSTALGS